VNNELGGTWKVGAMS